MSASAMRLLTKCAIVVKCGAVSPHSGINCFARSIAKNFGLVSMYLRAVEERVAKKYGLGISTQFGESYFSLWGVPVASKKAALFAHLASAQPDTVNLIEVHVAERTPEMEVIFDMNAPSQNTPEAGVVAHRKAELETMLSPELAELVGSGKIRLITSRQLVSRVGLAGMRRPR